MRFLHTMLRVGDLDVSLRFYCELLGMRLLRRKDYPTGRFTLAFVGYDTEDRHTVLATDIERATGTCTACTIKLAQKVEPSLPDHSGPIPGDLLTTNELLQPRTPNGTAK